MTDLEQHLDAYEKLRNSIIEECAKVADERTPRKHEGTLAAHVVGNTIAVAIRALKTPS